MRRRFILSCGRSVGKTERAQIKNKHIKFNLENLVFGIVCYKNKGAAIPRPTKQIGVSWSRAL